jgi:hypothetical protein
MTTFLMVEEELRGHIQRAHPESYAIQVPRSLLERVIKEIELLRQTAGAVTSGESFDDIAKRQGRQQPTEEQRS